MLGSFQVRPVRWVLGMAIAFFAIALVLTLHRYYTFYASYDQGIFNQVFWNSSQGRFFQSSLSSQLSTNVVHAGEIPNVAYHRLGQHFTPSLMLWLPIYALFPSPVTLTVLMVTLITIAGLVLYVLARHHLQPGLSAMIVASYYGANAVIGPTWCNFHDSCQTPLFVFLLLLGLEKRWWWLYGLMAVVLPWVREDSGVVLFSIGFYFLATRVFTLWQNWRSGRQGDGRRLGLEALLGAGLCLYSFAYVMVITNFAMAQFSADATLRFGPERFGQYIDEDGGSSLEILQGIFSNPLVLLRELISPADKTLLYLLGQWLPLALVPAISPAAWMAAGAPLFKLFMAKGVSVLAINIRYAMTVVPGLFYGAILWWKEHPKRFENLRFRRFWVACIVLSMIFTVIANPNRTISYLIPDSVQPWVYVSPLEMWRHSKSIYNVIGEIPGDASVSATTYVVPHLSSRREIVRFPSSLDVINDREQAIAVTYAVADLWQMRRYQAAFGGDRSGLIASVGVIDQVLREGRYGILRVEDGVILMKHKAVSTLEGMQQWQAFRQSVEGLGILGTAGGTPTPNGR